MRVLIVTQYFWPEEFRINDCAAELRRRGHEVTVLTGQPSYPSRDLFAGRSTRLLREEEWEGVAVRRVPLASRGRGQGWRLALNFLTFAASASLLGPLLARGRYDVVFVYEPSPVTVGIPGAALSRARRAPLVFWVQDLWPETLRATGAVRSPRLLAGLDRLVRWIYRSSERVLVESQAFVPHVTATGAAPERVRYLPNWAESSYAPVEVSADAPERALLPAGFTVLFAGNLGTAQSLETLLDAAERLRHTDVSWVLLGDGRQRDWLAAQVAARGLSERVHLLGRFPSETMPRFFALADALLVTLRREPIYALTIPSKLQSYLACGRPVLAALDGEGAAVVERAGAGLTVPAQDGAALAEAVLRLRGLPEEDRAAMGARGRAYFLEHFERDRLLTELEKILLEAGQPVAVGG